MNNPVICAKQQYNNTTKVNLLKYFCRKRELSPDHIGKYSLDKHGYVDLSNQRIDCSYLANKYIRCNFYKSLFAHSDTIYRIEGKAFIDSLFCGTIFKAAAEHGNKFYNCIFDSVNFKEAIIGYGSSCYTNCTFKNVRFGAFIKPQFKGCKFIDCNFYDVDFQASSFEHCAFIGKVENVWFRGGFPTDSLRREFGHAKPNIMLDVSFENAILHDVTFSDNCDLSTIVLPRQGRYVFFDNWDKQLNIIKKKGITHQSATTKDNIISFVEIYKVHSDSQRYYILNTEDLLKEYSEKAVEIIKENATTVIENSRI